MNNYIIKYSLLVTVFIPLLIFHSCKEDDNSESSVPAPVFNVTYVPTSGGAIIIYDLPEDKNLLYVKAVYVNLQNDEVFKVCSRYGNTIEIDGFIDEEPHTVKLYSVSNGGTTESVPVEITVVPGESYIFQVQKSLQVEAALGGIRISWNNPAKKMVHVYVNYSTGGKAYEKIFSSERENYFTIIRGLESVEYIVSNAVEDQNKNITPVKIVGEVTPKKEEKINKSTWELVKNLSCTGDKWEGKMVNFWDDVIDTNTNPNDNSYFIIHRDDNGGSLRFLSATEIKPLMIVIDLKKQVVMSRLMIWQRAYLYHANDGSANSEYLYYKEDNMRAFNVFVTNDLNEITKDNLWNNPLIRCDIGEPEKDSDGNILPSEYARAAQGHEFELPFMTEPFRYIVIGIVSTFGSETQICSSEISIYGLDNQ